MYNYSTYCIKEISYIFLLYFMVLFLIFLYFCFYFLYISFTFTVLLKQLRRLYTGGFIFQVLLVSDYINAYLYIYCTSLLFTRLVYQLPACKALTNQGGSASVYRLRSLLWYRRKSPSQRAYDTICISCPGIWLTCTIKLVRTVSL